MRALVVGAGIGGLTLALKLAARGIEATLLESAHELTELGVGINLLPHGVRELLGLGLGPALAETGIATRELRYLTRHGRAIHADPRGEAAGFRWPQYSIHRGRLQAVLAAAVRERLGAGAIRPGHHLAGFAEREDRVEAWFVDKASGAERGRAVGDLLVGCDGVRSAVRTRFYPEEGPPIFAGMMMWRGAVEAPPFLDGRTMVMAGHWHQKAVIYPISAEAARRGRALVNWVGELRIAEPQPWRSADWQRRGDRAEVLRHFGDWRFPFLDFPALIAATEAIFEYPMVDRDPLPRWSFGRVTLLGDAAHPMYPIGSNGASQAILDAEALAAQLGACGGDIPAALAGYEAERRPATEAVILSNRRFGPERILQLAHERSGGQDVDVAGLISPAEIDAITEDYRRIAGFEVETLNRKG
jgi:2-polyprenyl-6-methoxyphenol hydroxylase-like FAD-dependent oxidoreductase